MLLIINLVVFFCGVQYSVVSEGKKACQIRVELLQKILDLSVYVESGNVKYLQNFLIPALHNADISLNKIWF